ncbi:MAG: protein phosphatase 2C domain-containing protein [Lachnospiraceae bacterium]|nr:protein phosphatase 2C domain-containing protein [Lachnospiraceae bacterium]
MARCRYYFRSEKSKDPCHENNEDSFLHSRFTIMNDVGIDVMAVSDGIGGLSNGHVASHAAVTAFMETFYREILELYTPYRKNLTCIHYCGELKEAMVRAFAAANDNVLCTAASGIRQGATLSAAVLAGDYLITGNIGDSPIYYYNKEENRMDQIAVLQTQAEEDVMEGKYERYSDAYFENDYLLTYYMGQYSKLPENLIHFHVQEKVMPGDQLLLVSDGAVGRMLPETVYANLMSSDEEKALSILFEEALKDKDDDQTAMWIRIG